MPGEAVSKLSVLVFVVGEPVWWRGYGLDDVGFDFREWQDSIFSSPKCPQHMYAAQPHLPSQRSVQWLPSFFPWGIERHWIVIECSCLSVADIKNGWIHTSTPLYAFMACTGTILLFFTARHLPYFSIDNAHLMYNAHPKLFRHYFWCIDNAHDVFFDR